MEKLEEIAEQCRTGVALGGLMAASGMLMEVIGVDADRWSTDWTSRTDAENLETVRERIVTAAAYIQERQ